MNHDNKNNNDKSFFRKIEETLHLTRKVPKSLTAKEKIINNLINSTPFIKRLVFTLGNILGTILTTILTVILLAPDGFFDFAEVVVDEWLEKDPLFIKIQGTKVETIIEAFDYKYNTASGIATFNSERDLFITYLNVKTPYIWRRNEIELGEIYPVNFIHGHLLRELAVKKCIYIEPSYELIEKRPHNHLIFCEILGNRAALFTVLPATREEYIFIQEKEKIKNVILPQLSLMSNKIEAANLRLENPYQTLRP